MAQFSVEITRLSGSLLGGNQHVVGLCRDLNVECVVEGMETEGQTAILRSLGCNSMQGYYFGKPLPGDKVEDLLLGEAQPHDMRVA